MNILTNTLTNTLKLRHKAEEASADLPALMVMAEKAVISTLHGDHSQRKPGSGEKFWQYRDYVPGDRPQDIDWRQSAKGNHIYIKQKEWQTTQSAIFWCNEGVSMDFTSDEKYPSKALAAKILTLALAILMTRADEQIGLYGASRTGRTELALQRMGEVLCDDAREFEDLPDPFGAKLPRHCSLIQIGDFLSPTEETEDVFRKLSSQADNGFVIQVLDPAELELPYSGRYIFEDSGSKSREQISHVDSIRESYKQRIEDHINALEHICRDQHWGYILHRTDQDLSDTLSNVWGAMSCNALEAGEAEL